MSFSLAKFKSVLSSGNKNDQLEGSGSLEPEIGFKLSYNQSTQVIFVNVIGARHLPSFFGLTRAQGYITKIKLFPGDAKYETSLQESSWPCWNEDFKFQLNKDLKKNEKCRDLSGFFLSLTIYALLEKPKPATSSKIVDKKTGKVAEANEDKPKSSFLDKAFDSFKKTKPEQSQQKCIFEKRRTLGVATWTFDKKMFHNNYKNGFVGTPDIWRPINQIATSVSHDINNDNNKGQLEVTLLYTSSENGMNDVIQVTVHRLRCNVRIMQEQEKFKEPLYLKAVITDENKAEVFWKSDRFVPTISARWDPKQATVKLNVFKVRLDKVSVYFSIGCKTKMGKKEILGKAVISKDSPHADVWKQCLSSPGITKTVWVSFI